MALMGLWQIFTDLIPISHIVLVVHILLQGLKSHFDGFCIENANAA